MKTLRQKGYSLVEVVIVVAILSVIAVTGYRCLMYLTKEATQTSRAVTNPRRAQYDRFVGVLNDRLGQAWAFTPETASLQGIKGTQLRLYDAGGQEFAEFGMYTDGTAYQYEIADAGGPAPLDFKYAFTNRDRPGLSPQKRPACKESTGTSCASMTRAGRNSRNSECTLTARLTSTRSLMRADPRRWISNMPLPTRTAPGITHFN